MPTLTLTVGEAKARLAECRSEAQALYAALATLNPRGRVTAFGPNPVPVPFAKCSNAPRDYIIVEDVALALREIIGWLDDVAEGLSGPDERAFAEEPLA